MAVISWMMILVKKGRERCILPFSRYGQQALVCKSIDARTLFTGEQDLQKSWKGIKSKHYPCVWNSTTIHAQAEYELKTGARLMGFQEREEPEDIDLLSKRKMEFPMMYRRGNSSYAFFKHFS